MILDICRVYVLYIFIYLYTFIYYATSVGASVFFHLFPKPRNHEGNQQGIGHPEDEGEVDILGLSRGMPFIICPSSAIIWITSI